jgi:hypothetical protein
VVWCARSVGRFGDVEAVAFIWVFVAVVCVVVELVLIGGGEIGVAYSAFRACAVCCQVVARAVGAWVFGWCGECTVWSKAGASYVLRCGVDWAVGFPVSCIGDGWRCSWRGGGGCWSCVNNTTSQRTKPTEHISVYKIISYLWPGFEQF